MRRALAVVWMVAGGWSGCWSEPVHPTVAPGAAAGPPATPACTPQLTVVTEPEFRKRIVLAGSELRIAVDSDDGKTDGATVVYPETASSVLFSWTSWGPYGRPAGGDTLYRVDCASKALTVVARVAGADFGHSARTRDGRTIYYSAIGGVWGLDLATRTQHRVTPSVTLATCGDREVPTDDAGSAAPWIALSAVRQLIDDDATLIYEDGDNCGFEGDWDSTVHYVDHPERTGGTPYTPRPVGPVVADAGGALYAVMDAVVWRSADRGDHWQRAALPGGGGDAPTEVVADDQHPGYLAALTTVPGDPFRLAQRFAVTRDGGRTWTVLPSPPLAATEHVDIGLGDGSLDQLRVWGSQVVANGSLDDAAWQWGGDPADWQLLDPTPPRPAAAPPSPVLAGIRFAASPHGLLRYRPGNSKPTRVFPQ
jgi:hypothetical protein|nr:hypothetical protein [Kofleriaceae bacterium]